jgi:hypothetical protein
VTQAQAGRETNMLAITSSHTGGIAHPLFGMQHSSHSVAHVATAANGQNLGKPCTARSTSGPM